MPAMESKSSSTSAAVQSEEVGKEEPVNNVVKEENTKNVEDLVSFFNRLFFVYSVLFFNDDLFNSHVLPSLI